MKQLTKILGVGLLVCSLMPVTLAATDGLKIGIIDMNIIMQKAPEVKAINNKLKAKFQPRQDKLIAAEKSLNEDIAKLERDKAVLSAKEASKLEEKIVRQRRDLQRQQQDFQQDLMMASNESMQTFRTSVDAAVNKIAKKGNYDE